MLVYIASAIGESETMIQQVVKLLVTLPKINVYGQYLLRSLKQWLILEYRWKKE